MNTILCPNCKNPVEITEALKHQIEEQVLRDVDQKYKDEFEKKSQEIEEKAIAKAKSELEFTLKDSQNELQEAKEQGKELRNQLLELTKQLRGLKQKDEEREVTMQKKIMEERERMQEEIGKSERKKSNLEKLELQKQLDDTKKALEDAQRKVAQKSQQLQGEVLELELEKVLANAFVQDEIVPVGKGISGADIRHIVKSPRGRVCGTILWESKRTKEWSDKWVSKLKEDMRTEKADLAVIVSITLPEEAKDGFGQKENVYICCQALVIPLAVALRKNLLDIGYQKAISENKGEKAELLYSYVTSHEFQQQIETIVEVYKDMQNQILRERVAYEKAWKVREAQAQRIVLSTANIIGNMQGRVGASMPQIKGLEISQLDNGDDEQLNLIEN